MNNIEEEMKRIEDIQKKDPNHYELTSALVTAKTSTNCHHDASRFTIAERTLEELEKLGYKLTKI